MKPFTKIIVHAHDRTGWSYRTLAQKADISAAYVKEIREGKIPSDEVVYRLAQALGLNTAEMLMLAGKERASSEEVKHIYDLGASTLTAAVRADTTRHDELDPRQVSKPPPDLVRVPVFDAQAGQPASWTDGGYPTGYSSEYEYLPANLVDENSFCVTIHGNSMEPNLSEGDRVLVKPSAPLVNGRLCFASFPGEDGDRLVKRYYRYEDTIVLRSDNPAYDEITLSRENGRDVRIYRVWRSIRQE